MPRIILAPIISVWFGFGIAGKVALGVTLVFFMVFFNVYQGVKEVSPMIRANARMLGASNKQLLRHVYLPSATSWVFSSLHTSLGLAFVGAVVGEYPGSSQGVGYLILQAEGTFDINTVMAGILVPEKGSVTIDGRVSALLELGAGFHPELSGKENVCLNGAILGLSKKEITARFDDIVDFAEQTADALGLYGVEAPMEQSTALADVLVGAGEQVARALRCLRTGTELAPHLVEIHRLENEGDRLSRDAIASLFAGGIDPMVVIRWKDIFERLEDGIDATERTANVLEGIRIKKQG